MSRTELERVNAQIVDCARCPRLVWWREEAARHPPRRFAGEPYWARPLPGFGDPDARILVVGLAPAAHGGNRTGRLFTGDASGDFLFAALHRAGMANQPASISAGDGMRLSGIYIGAVNRCAPPANKPTPVERDNCLPYLAAEMAALNQLRVIIALGVYAWDGVFRALAVGGTGIQPRPRFGHGAETVTASHRVIGCYHPSQQNTFTRRLTPPMLDAILRRAKEAAAPTPAS